MLILIRFELKNRKQPSIEKLKIPAMPVFETIDYGITGDLFKVVPMLIEETKTAKADK